MRDVIDLCWYMPWLREGCQDRLAASASTSFLLVAQHVSGNVVPIIRSRRLRDNSLVLVYAVAAGRLSRPVGR